MTGADTSMSSTVLVSGGGGFVGTVLTERLLGLGHTVTVHDTFWFGDFLADHPRLTKVRGDLRDARSVDTSLDGVDTVIQLACLSNDPSSDLDADLTRSINLVGCRDIIHAARRRGVKRFIYGSSASVYGVRDEPDIVEDMRLAPITLYSRYKAEIEEELFRIGDPGFTTVAVRNSTVSGFSRRMRLDLIISIFVRAAMRKGLITIEGGEQLRPLIHMQDLVDFYVLLLGADAATIHQQAFNVSADNYKVIDVARMVQARIPCELAFAGYSDPRSYRVNTNKVERLLGYRTSRSIESAIDEIMAALGDGRIDDEDPRCYNTRYMKTLVESGAAADTVPQAAAAPAHGRESA
jgi:nucleoside-diphosphate-sugar epimerase